MSVQQQQTAGPSNSRRASAARLNQDLPDIPVVFKSPQVPISPSAYTHNQSDSNFDRWSHVGSVLSAAAQLNAEGRVELTIDATKAFPDLPPDYAPDIEEYALEEESGRGEIPSLNIVIQIVGSRGDVQPYMALGLALQSHGHRVRIATHPTFRTFVRTSGLEFFSIGGDPEDLMSYMVQNPGLLPGMETILGGAIGKKRKMIAEMLDGCYRSTFEADPGHNSEAADAPLGPPFAADAIISNPPAFAHVHIAEATGLPLHLSFTMPWSPTSAFHHPLASISSNTSSTLTNYLSYAAVDMLTWQGLSSPINTFRTQTLGLPALTVRTGPGVVDHLKIPYTYCWSPALIPKPADWKQHIDLAGFYFLDGSAGYTPPNDVSRFLAAGPPPIYIGFGSIPLKDPDAMTDILFKAVTNIGARAIISAGWAKLGGGGKIPVPDNILILGNCPHDWLFPRCSVVVHHGGAGTCAIGLRLGKPTIIIPFFGDQPFWGEMCARAGAGPPPIPFKSLTALNLTHALLFALSPKAKAAAARLGENIQGEDGVARGVESFYRHLPLLNMRCDIAPNQVAVWWSHKYCLKLGSFAAQVLADARLLELKTLEIHRPKAYNPQKEYSDPLSASAVSVLMMLSDSVEGISKLFYRPTKGLVKIVSDIPRGFFNIFASLTEGLSNLPGLYGSPVRDTGRITSFGSGIAKAGKGFYYGLADGCIGLVAQPYRGHKKDGWVGVLKGSTQGILDLAIKPCSGTLGLIFHPISGAIMSARSSRVRKQTTAFRAARVLAGREAVLHATKEEIEDIVKAWPTIKRGTKLRKRETARRVEELLKDIQAGVVVLERRQSA